MVDKKTWDKVLTEIEKTGIILHACRKAGIDASTLHRQKKKDKKFAKEIEAAMEIGRANISDIGESALMRKVQEGDFNAIKYLLNHNSERYKTKQQDTFKYLFDHRSNKVDSTPQVTIEDIFERMTQDNMKRAAEKEVADRARMMREIDHARPLTPEGQEIYPWELHKWEPQVSEWRRAVREALENGTPLPSDRLKPIEIVFEPEDVPPTPPPKKRAAEPWTKPERGIDDPEDFR